MNTVNPTKNAARYRPGGQKLRRPMRNLLLVAVACLFTLNAHASKARTEALQGAKFLKDPQTIFINPAHVNSLGQYFTAEFGNQSTNPSAPKAEGGMLIDAVGGKLGFYLGHMSTMQYRMRAGESYYNEQNPVEVTYGNGVWGASAFYSKSDKNTTAEGQTTAGIRLGAQMDKLEVYATIDAYARSKKNAGAKYKSNPAVNVGAEYEMGDYYLFGDLTYVKTKQDITGKTGADYDAKTVEIGAQNHKQFSVAGRTFYFGLSAKYDIFEKQNNSIYTFTLPLVAGMEYDVTDWAVVRGSITQNFLLGHTKDQTAASPLNGKDTITNNTTVAAGAGFKFKGFELDGLLAAASTGAINGSSFLTKAALTYNF
jgi:hypothetical protein